VIDGDGGENTMARWPNEFARLTRELRSDRGRPAVIETAGLGTDRLLERLRPVVDEVVSIGERLTQLVEPPTVDQLVRDINSPSTLLIDIDVLFTPSLRINVMSQLRRIAQDTALIVAWPGRITAGRLSYSLPGRADHVDEPARDMIVLHPADAEFPDEVPYNVQRYRP
jgi:hypothetical protein